MRSTVQATDTATCEYTLKRHNIVSSEALPTDLKGHCVLRCLHIWFLKFERLSCSFIYISGRTSALFSKFTAKEKSYCFSFSAGQSCL